MIKRFWDYLKKEKKVEKWCAIISYMIFIIISLGEKIQCQTLCEEILYGVLVFVFGVTTIYCVLIQEDELRMDIKKIITEVVFFMPFQYISWRVVAIFVQGDSANQVRLMKDFAERPIFFIFECIIFAPICEEIICRLFPSFFLKNKVMYVVITSVVFAALHVVNDPRPFYYIWAYLPNSFYYGWRFYQTKDVRVTMALHAYNNLVALAFMSSKI